MFYDEVVLFFSICRDISKQFVRLLFLLLIVHELLSYFYMRIVVSVAEVVVGVVGFAHIYILVE